MAQSVWRLDQARLVHVPSGIDLARFAGKRGADDGVTIGTVAAPPEKNLGRPLLDR